MSLNKETKPNQNLLPWCKICCLIPMKDAKYLLGEMKWKNVDTVSFVVGASFDTANNFIELVGTI